MSTTRIRITFYKLVFQLKSWRMYKTKYILWVYDDIPVDQHWTEIKAAMLYNVSNVFSWLHIDVIGELLIIVW